MKLPSCSSAIDMAASAVEAGRDSARCMTSISHDVPRGSQARRLARRGFVSLASAPGDVNLNAAPPGSFASATSYLVTDVLK